MPLMFANGLNLYYDAVASESHWSSFPVSPVITRCSLNHRCPRSPQLDIAACPWTIATSVG